MWLQSCYIERNFLEARKEIIKRVATGTIYSVNRSVSIGEAIVLRHYN
jgi:hypothetical protein